MPAYNKLLPCAALCLVSTLCLKGQSIIDDVHSLLWSVSILDDSSSTGGQADSAAVVLLGILSRYDQAPAADSAHASGFDFLLERYAGSELLPEIAGLDIGRRTSISGEELRARAAQAKAAPPREAILDRLGAAQPVSPADYLSVTKTLRQYQTPSFPPVQAIRLSAASSNSNVSGAAPPTQAAIIQGTARFILERAREEVILNFMERMLSGDQNSFLVLFPTVAQEFSNSPVSISGSFIARLRDAFHTDLQALSLRLPEVMLEDSLFADIQADMTGYNLLALYSLLNLVQQDVPVEEALPVVNRYLYSMFLDKARQSNLQLAAKAAQDARYGQLVSLSRSAYMQMADIYRNLEKGESDVLSMVDGAPDREDAPPSRSLYLGKPLYRFGLLLNPGTGSHGLDLLPQLLQGSFDSATIMAYNTLPDYDRFFSEEWVADTLRAAGLELAQKLCGNWYEDKSIADILGSWKMDLLAYQQAARQWLSAGQAPEPEDLGQLTASLRNDIITQRRHWENSVVLNHQQRLAFLALENLLSETVFQGMEDELRNESFLDAYIADNFDRLLDDLKREHLQAVALRLNSLDASLQARHPGLGPPAAETGTLEELLPFQDIEYKIGTLQDTLDRMKDILLALDAACGGKLAKARDNARPFIQLSGLASNLLYCFRTGGPKVKWLGMKQLDTLLDGGRKEAVFLGLVQQRLRNGGDGAPLSPAGLSDLARLTIRDLLLLSDTLQPESLRVTGNAAFFGKVFFASNTLGRLLEVPLVAGPGGKEYLPLKDRLGSAAQIPAISEELLRFLYFINMKQHGKAISSMMRLFIMLDELNPNSEAATADFLGYLQRYGDFIGGLVDAETGDDVKELLDQIADPPGSSRIKRKSPLSASINAYAGMNFGQERWTGNERVREDEFWSPAVALPVGVALSWQLFPNSKRPQSFSAFFCLLDVAAAIPAADPEQADLEASLTFKNVFKPGLQLHWNIQRSPFYLGVGYQRGPVFVELNGRQDQVQAGRFFLGAGVDVPVMTLFRR